jgi:hypothetical protein
MKHKSKAQRGSPYDSNQFRSWADTMRTRLIPEMRDSANVLMIAPNMSAGFDIEFALQIGASILLEKPLILLVDRKRSIPPKLRAIADRIIETDFDMISMDAPDIQRQLTQAFKDFEKQ